MNLHLSFYASERHIFLAQTPFGFSYVPLSCYKLPRITQPPHHHHTHQHQFLHPPHQQLHHHLLQHLHPHHQLYQKGRELLDKKIRKRVSLIGRILFGGEESVDDLRCIVEQLLSLRKLVDGHDSENGVAADEGVVMLEVGEDGRDEKLDDLRLIEATEETEGDAANVLVGVLEVVAEVLAYQRELCLKRVNEENGMWEQNVGGAA
ncbi:hypothetical protein DEO72_LG4g2239 [Vigna unguiculata]|uniref:Uncharacterized protein n=1 Tax=Vigna unguiculata TaxID=3917 RepID=A0A4D6KS04_VIGUN|nr:hypothetical protein DEO72_LG1g245 [Vigna unguiculata]QCD91274.1 hypothetical protein DEO72_LG4g2239 [Vigna unguiculata]